MQLTISLRWMPRVRSGYIPVFTGAAPVRLGVGHYHKSMTEKLISLLLALAGFGTLAAGCSSTQTSGVVPHKIKVIDASTQRPVAGAHIMMYGPSGSMGQTTDDLGVMRVGAYVFYSMPKMEEIEVTKPGYDRVFFRMTNGLPDNIEMTPVPVQK